MSNDLSIKPSDITSEAAYLHTRRRAVQSLGTLMLAGFGTAADAASDDPPYLVEANFAPLPHTKSNAAFNSTEPVSPWREKASYGLYHEFGEGNVEPLQKAALAPAPAEPWTVRVEGEVRNPKTYDVDQLRGLAPMEERIHRLRCFGGWVMVVPCVGYALAEVLRRAEPTGDAKFVEFTSHWDAAVMANAYYRWPYVESLRLDEAMHPLTLLTFGHQGRVLPRQNGAPLRLVVPWKFAHKSPKALVRIRLTRVRPPAFFFTQYSDLYGWYRNVHPELPQNGSQRRERRVGEWLRQRETPLLNGLAEQVAPLYGSELNTLR